MYKKKIPYAQTIRTQQKNKAKNILKYRTGAEKQKNNIDKTGLDRPSCNVPAHEKYYCNDPKHVHKSDRQCSCRHQNNSCVCSTYDRHFIDEYMVDDYPVEEIEYIHEPIDCHEYVDSRGNIRGICRPAYNISLFDELYEHM